MPGGYSFDGRVSVPAFDAATTGDTAAAIPFTNYLVRRVTLYGASANLATTTATLGLYTATGGGGTTLVTAALLTGHTASTVVLDLTLALPTTSQTVATLYLRIVQGAVPVAGTIKAVVEVEPLA